MLKRDSEPRTSNGISSNEQTSESNSESTLSSKKKRVLSPRKKVILKFTEICAQINLFDWVSESMHRYRTNTENRIYFQSIFSCFIPDSGLTILIS